MAKPCSIFVGQQYGYWTVLEDAGRVGANHCYLCRCVCGKEKLVAQSGLKSGRLKSCGCRKDNSRSNGIYLTGQMIGSWQVIALAERNAQGRKQYTCVAADVGKKRL